jgi:hypothetical protein
MSSALAHPQISNVAFAHRLLAASRHEPVDLFEGRRAELERIELDQRASLHFEDVARDQTDEGA